MPRFFPDGIVKYISAIFVKAGPRFCTAVVRGKDRRMGNRKKKHEDDSSHLPQVAALTWQEGSRAAVRRSHARPDTSPWDAAYVMT